MTPQEVEAIQIPETAAIIEAVIKTDENNASRVSGFAGDYIVVENGYLRIISRDKFEEDYMPQMSYQVGTSNQAAMDPQLLAMAAQRGIVLPGSGTVIPSPMGEWQTGQQPTYIPQ